jgi:hypothetical protein
MIKKLAIAALLVALLGVTVGVANAIHYPPAYFVYKTKTGSEITDIANFLGYCNGQTDCDRKLRDTMKNQPGWDSGAVTWGIWFRTNSSDPRRTQDHTLANGSFWCSPPRCRIHARLWGTPNSDGDTVSVAVSYEHWAGGIQHVLDDFNDAKVRLRSDLCTAAPGCTHYYMWTSNPGCYGNQGTGYPCVNHDGFAQVVNFTPNY